VDPECTQPEFWEERYRANRMPWDQGGAPPALLNYLRRAREKGTVLLPGCGLGYEIRAFHEFGWQPRAIDFSPAAVERARTVLGPLATAVRLADFFGDDVRDPFDFVYERTFLCSMPPERWPDYARRMAELLKPKGRLIGIFAYGEEPEPPPYPLTESTARTVFESRFSLIENETIPADQSLPLYAGQERWQVWQRR
jgi:SAM-dependent methyltransferase